MSDAPVFIMSTSRSGSTLLRFILDSHPDLACPPETMIGRAGAALIRLWEFLEHAGDAERTDPYKQLDISAEGLGTIRMALDSAYNSYLKRRGKKRWCDKSLDTYQFVEAIQAIYPEAKFICLVRHCMDVVASGARICPWGLSRFGFDPFVAQFPGNTVAAIGAYWLSCTRAILEFRDQNPDSCLLVRYEDLVTAPEETVSGILDFIDEEPSPGITESCFDIPHEQRGPGDEKIWFTDHVTADSMGEGISVPAMALPSDMRKAINHVLTQLRYKTIGEDWACAVGGLDPRADAATATASAAVSATADAEGDAPSRAELDHIARTLGDRLAAPSARPAAVVSQWPSVAGVTVRLVADAPTGDHAEIRWQFPAADDANASDVNATTAPPADADAGAGAGAGAAEWPLMIASCATWAALLDGKANVITEITGGRLRCFNPNDGHRIRSDEVHAIGAVLGLATVPVG